jgi:hypothetical protein
MGTCAQLPAYRQPDVTYTFDENVVAVWAKFAAQTLVETNTIVKILSGPRKRMVRRARIKPHRPVITPIVVPPEFERDVNELKTRVNYMMQVRVEAGKGAFFDTYYHAQRYPNYDTLMALQRLRKKFPNLVLGEDEKRFWKKMIGSEPLP